MPEAPQDRPATETPPEAPGPARPAARPPGWKVSHFVAAGGTAWPVFSPPAAPAAEPSEPSPPPR